MERAVQSLPSSAHTRDTQPGDHPPLATGAASDPRVLVVDDDPEIRETLELALEESGYAVSQAADGQSALRELRASPHGMVVLVDRLMPRLEGTDFVRIVSRDGDALKRHRYVLMTASPNLLAEADVVELAAAEIPILAKPFNLDDVLALVATAASHLRSQA